MTEFAEDQMLTAVAALLNTAIPLQGSADGAIVTGIFDANSIPSDQAFPYIVTGTTTATPIDTFTKNGMNMTLAIHTWSRYSGKKQLNQLRGLIYDTLHGATLTMQNYSGTMTFDSGNTMSDDSTSIKLMHGTDRYRLKAT